MNTFQFISSFGGAGAPENTENTEEGGNITGSTSVPAVPGVSPGVRVSGTLPQRGSLCSPGAVHRSDGVAVAGSG